MPTTPSSASPTGPAHSRTPSDECPGGATFAHHQPDGALIFQQMSALATKAGSANFAQGIPEAVFDDQWRAALHETLQQEHFQYVPSRGLPELRQAISQSYGVSAEQCVVTSGCTESLTATLLALASDGLAQVVTTEPFYSFYPGMAAYAGVPLRCVPMNDCATHWVFPVEELISLMHQRRKGDEPIAIVMNSPHNPTGAVLSHAQWLELAAAAEATGAWLLIDDAYRDFIFDGDKPPYRELLESGRVVIAGSISKSLAAAGNRVGWTLAPPSIMSTLDDAHMHQSYCTPAFMQQATALVWSRVGDNGLRQVCETYSARADSLTQALEARGCSPRRSSGGFFVTASAPSQRDTHPSGAPVAGLDLAQWFTIHYGVTPLPLDPFFASGQASRWLRWSCTLPDAIHDEALHKLRA